MPARTVAHETLCQDQPIIFMKYAPHRQAEQGETLQDFQAFLASRNYRILVNTGPTQGDSEAFRIGEIDELAKLSLMTDVLLVPAESDRMPTDIMSATSSQKKRYILVQKLRHWSGIPKRLLRRFRHASSRQNSSGISL